MVARLLLVLSLSICCCDPGLINAQPATDAADDSRKTTAEKFLQVFLNRPQAGTALSKVVEYYQSIGQFEELLSRIQTQATEAQANRPNVAAKNWLAAALIVQTQARWLESLELLDKAQETDSLRWEIACVKSVALEQLQRWNGLIAVLEPEVETVLARPNPGDAQVVIETSQRLAKAYARSGQSEKAYGIWLLLENRFGNDQQVAMRMASMAASEGELVFAMEILDRLMARMSPSVKRVELEVQRNSILARSGNIAAALAKYEQLLQGLKADSWLADDISRRIEDLILATDGVDGLIQHYRRQSQARPDDLQVLLRLASWLDAEQKWDESNQLFQRLLQRTTSAVEPRSAYAKSLVHQKRWRDASQQWEKLAEIAPQDEDIVVQWCETLAGDPDLPASTRDQQLQEILERSMRTMPAAADNYQQLAARLQRFGLETRALEWLAKAYELRPDDWSVVADYARALAEADREQASVKVLADYERAHVTDRDQLAQLADLLNDLGHSQLAIDTLTKACNLGATTGMRFRLADWLGKAGSGEAAEQQFELAWAELAKHTTVVGEQEALCEEITRRQITLAQGQQSLPRYIEKLSKDVPPSQDKVAGLSAEALHAWRLASFLLANEERDAAARTLSIATADNSESGMLWRLQAELDERTKNWPQVVEAYQKLANLDARRRSEYLLKAARGLARMDKLEAALRLTESITTETASSELVIDVYNLASEHGAERFAVDLLNKRIASRPGDMDVLSRLISLHLRNKQYPLAAELQWRTLELMRTAEQREAVVRMLIDMHYEMRSLPDLEKKLDKFWRRSDLWREFGIWQVLIAMKGQDFPRAEQLLRRLLQSQLTRRFALEQLLDLTASRNEPVQRIEWMKQLAAIDPQAVSGDEIAKILIAMPQPMRTQVLAQEALSIVQGPSKRFALIQDLLQAGDVDLVLRLIEVLPEQEQLNWPIVARAALASASFHQGSEPALRHVVHSHGLLDRFIEKSLELPNDLTGESLLLRLFDQPAFLADFLIVSTLSRHSPDKSPIFSGAAVQCPSKLQAYQAVVAAQMQMADTPQQRRQVWEKHRAAALKQTSARERSIRLASLAFASHWQAHAPAYNQAISSLNGTLRKGDRDVDGRLYHTMHSLIQQNLLNDKGQPRLLTDQLAQCREAFRSIVEWNELSDQGDSLAALLALWGTTSHDKPLSSDPVFLERMRKLVNNAEEFSAFVPSQLVAKVVLLDVQNLPPGAEDPLVRKLASLTMSPTDQRKLIESALVEQDPMRTELLIRALGSRIPLADWLGDVLCSRNSTEPVRGIDVLIALDAVWKDEVSRGLRRCQELELPVSNLNSQWLRKLPISSIAMRESSMFKQVDFELIRAIIAQTPSNAGRQEILQKLKSLSEEFVEEDLRLVRRLARIFVWELLEQDMQSAQLLDETLPVTSDPSKSVLRGLWLEVTGRPDLAIEWWLKSDQWPEHLRGSVAGNLLRLGINRHHDQAIDTAIQRLGSSTNDLDACRDLVPSLITLNKLEQAEALLSHAKVLMVPVQELDVYLKMFGAANVSQELLVRWQQTDQLFVLLRKHSLANNQVGASRIASRLLEAVRHVSETEFRERRNHFITRLENAFIQQDQLVAFLSLEAQRLKPEDARREGLCLMRMSLNAEKPALARSIADLIKAKEMNAVESFEVAHCELQLGNFEVAASLYARAFELEPDWLETTIRQLGENRLLVPALGKQLNNNPRACAGVGRETLDVLLDAINPGTLRQYENVLLCWANSTRPKSLAQLHRLLRFAAGSDYRLWLKLVESLLINENLQPISLHYESAALGANRRPTARATSSMEKIFFEVIADPAKREPFEEMLDDVLRSSRFNFTAHLLLTRIHLANGKFANASDQLQLLIQSAVGRSPVKSWIIEDWVAQSARSLGNNGPARAAAMSQLTQTQSAVGLDTSCRIELLGQLADAWPRETATVAARFQILELIANEGGLTHLKPDEQVELLKGYVDKKDEAGVLALFEPNMKNLRPMRRPVTPSYSPFSDAALSLLSSYGMHWQRHLILVRAAQIEQLPLEKSNAYLLQINLNKPGAVPSVQTYPLETPASELLIRLISQSRQQLSATNSNSSAFQWSDAFKPVVVLDTDTNKIHVLSMLDALWPLGKQLSDDEVLARLKAEVDGWSKDVRSMEPWSVLALHNMAARLRNIQVVQQCQDRLLELAESGSNTDRKWWLASWSAVMASQGVPEVAPQRLKLTELARRAAGADKSLNDLHLAMTLTLFDELFAANSDAALRTQVLSELERLIVEQRRPAGGIGTGEVEMRVKANLLMFDKLMAKDETDVAMGLVESMWEHGLIYATATGIAHANRKLATTDSQMLDAFQKLIDQRWRPEKMQVLWERLLLGPLPKQPLGEFEDWQDNPVVPVKVQWQENSEPMQMLAEYPMPPNMFSQLIQLATINNSLPRLEALLTQRSPVRSGGLVCAALVAVQRNNIDEALRYYRKATDAKNLLYASDSELELVSIALFNALRQDPLSEAAVDYSLIATQRALTQPSLALIQQQLYLAARQSRSALVSTLAEGLSKSPLPIDLRQRIRIELACNLLETQQSIASFESYARLVSQGAPISDKPDRYLLSLLNRLPTLPETDQAVLFRYFATRKFENFPWLEVYSLPVGQQLPKRFRSVETSRGLVFESVEQQRSWVGFLPWLARYAQRTEQVNEAMEAAAFSGTNYPSAAWGAAALTVMLNSQLTPEALKNRLTPMAAYATGPRMQCVLDCCESREAMRDAAVEIILNMGFPEIALAPPASAKPVISGWKHWINTSEVTLMPSIERPRWSLAKSGEWTAHAAKANWYLMLRYPIEGDFELAVVAQQVSGTKFGIGYGGLTATQSVRGSSAIETAVHGVGPGDRRLVDAVPSANMDQSELPLRLSRRGATWSLQAANARVEEQAEDIIGCIHLFNHGPGVARIDQWQMTAPLKIAPKLNLIDNQMRLWRSTLGAWRLPALRLRSPELAGTPKTDDCFVAEGVVHLPAATPKDWPDAVGNSLHCLRPLLPDESFSYEFYHSSDSAVVHANLGRMVFRLQPGPLTLQWLARSEEMQWLDITGRKTFPIEAQESMTDVGLRMDAWNNVQLSRSSDDKIEIAVNGRAVAKVTLPNEVFPEIGITVDQSLPAKVRHMELRGDWPKSLDLEQLTSPASPDGENAR